MLEDKRYIDSVNLIIDQARNRDRNTDPGNQWESMKNDIIEHSKFWGRLKASENRKRKEELKRKLQSLEIKLACINLKSDLAIRFINKVNLKIDAVKQELENFSQSEITGVMIHSKA